MHSLMTFGSGLIIMIIIILGTKSQMLKQNVAFIRISYLIHRQKSF